MINRKQEKKFNFKGKKYNKKNNQVYKIVTNMLFS